MDVVVSTASVLPLYQQIYEQISSQIIRGQLESGYALPPIRTVAKDLRISVITVKRAYEELEREGIIFRRQGLGTFVAEQGHDRSRETKLAAAADLLRDGFREAAEAGLKPAEILDLAQEILKERK